MKARFPQYFDNVEVIEIGSLDINGSVRDFYGNTPRYIGVDLAEGKGVDLVAEGQDLMIGEKFNGDIVTMITQLEGEELIRFMVWCGFTRKFLLTANDGQIEKQIVNKWMQYRAIRTKAADSVLRNTP